MLRRSFLPSIFAAIAGLFAIPRVAPAGASEPMTRTAGEFFEYKREYIHVLVRLDSIEAINFDTGAVYVSGGNNLNTWMGLPSGPEFVKAVAKALLERARG